MAAAKCLNPIFEIEGHPLIMVTEHGAAVPALEFGERLCSLAAHDSEIMSAIDMLFTGY